MGKGIFVRSYSIKKKVDEPSKDHRKKKLRKIKTIDNDSIHNNDRKPKYNEEIVNELVNIGVGTREDCIKASKMVNDCDDINQVGNKVEQLKSRTSFTSKKIHIFQIKQKKNETHAVEPNNTTKPQKLKRLPSIKRSPSKPLPSKPLPSKPLPSVPTNQNQEQTPKPLKIDSNSGVTNKPQEVTKQNSMEKNDVAHQVQHKPVENVIIESAGTECDINADNKKDNESSTQLIKTIVASQRKESFDKTLIEHKDDDNEETFDGHNPNLHVSNDVDMATTEDQKDKDELDHVINAVKTKTDVGILNNKETTIINQDKIQKTNENVTDDDVSDISINGKSHKSVNETKQEESVEIEQQNKKQHRDSMIITNTNFDETLIGHKDDNNGGQYDEHNPNHLINDVDIGIDKQKEKDELNHVMNAVKTENDVDTPNNEIIMIHENKMQKTNEEVIDEDVAEITIDPQVYKSINEIKQEQSDEIEQDNNEPQNEKQNMDHMITSNTNEEKMLKEERVDQLCKTHDNKQSVGSMNEMESNENTKLKRNSLTLTQSVSIFHDNSNAYDEDCDDGKDGLKQPQTHDVQDEDDVKDEEDLGELFDQLFETYGNQEQDDATKIDWKQKTKARGDSFLGESRSMIDDNYHLYETGIQNVDPEPQRENKLHSKLNALKNIILEMTGAKNKTQQKVSLSKCYTMDHSLYYRFIATRSYQ